MSVTSLILIFSSSFMTLFPVNNPIGTGFIVNGYFAGLSSDQRSVAIKRLIINYIIIGVGTVAIGHIFLILFGLAIPVIQLGGGFLICRAALGLLSDGSSADNTSNAVPTANWEELQGKIFYPIVFPISVGPGSISVIFTLMANASVKNDFLQTGVNYLVIALVIFCLAGLLYLFLTQGEIIVKKLGTKGNMVINKLVAFFTFCIGIQIMVEGISKIFHLSIL